MFEPGVQLETPHTLWRHHSSHRGNLEVPRVVAFSPAKPQRGFTADTVLVLRRGLTAATRNQNVKQRKRGSKFLLGKQEAAPPPRPEGRGFQSG
jgi:hypothetical protein